MMSSKRITIVLGTLIVIIFGYMGYTDAVRTWQNLQEQENRIDNLNTEHRKLDQKLDKTTETKEKSQEEVQKLEQEKNKLEKERKRLEKELQAKNEAKARLAEASSRVVDAATNTQTAYASSGDMRDVITRAANKYGLSPAYMIRVATCESTLNPGAINRGYYAGGGNPSGLYQYLPETWKRISSRSPYGTQPQSEVFNGHTNANVTAWAFANGYVGEWACA